MVSQQWEGKSFSQDILPSGTIPLSELVNFLLLMRHIQVFNSGSLSFYDSLAIGESIALGYVTTIYWTVLTRAN